MSDYEIYSLLLCIIVFVLLTAVFSALLIYALRLKLTLVRAGLQDEKIKRGYEKERMKLRDDGVFFTVLPHIFSALLLLLLVFSLVLNATETQAFDDIPTVKVVKSASMASKNKRNDYLFENDLNDQFATFDMIVTEKLPDEFELELYDVVVYEIDGTMIVHRIVEIEEPNAAHPDCRYFRLQGDAVSAPDAEPVVYEQMISIYRGQKIPFLGSLVVFLQSPAGWLCVLLMLFATVAAPIVEKKLETERLIRLYRMGCFDRK